MAGTIFVFEVTNQNGSFNRTLPLFCDINVTPALNMIMEALNAQQLSKPHSAASLDAACATNEKTEGAPQRLFAVQTSEGTDMPKMWSIQRLVQTPGRIWGYTPELVTVGSICLRTLHRPAYVKVAALAEDDLASFQARLGVLLETFM